MKTGRGARAQSRPLKSSAMRTGACGTDCTEHAPDARETEERGGGRHPGLQNYRPKPFPKERDTLKRRAAELRDALRMEIMETTKSGVTGRAGRTPPEPARA